MSITKQVSQTPSGRIGRSSSRSETPNPSLTWPEGMWFAMTGVPQNAMLWPNSLAGLEVDTTGNDWLTVGDVTPALTAATTALAEAAVPTTPVADTAVVVEQLEAVITAYNDLRMRSVWDDLSDLPSESLGLMMRAQSLVDRYSTNPTYVAEAARVATEPTHIRIPILMTAVKAMHEDTTA